MNLETLLKIFADYSCKKIYVKRLSANDNSKNQIYFGGSFDVLNIFPSGDIFLDKDGHRKRESFKSKLSFFWINEEGGAAAAPNAQLISYPDYPEVRFSGFLLGCKSAPSELLNKRDNGRILFLGVSDDRKIFGYAISSETEVEREFSSLHNLETHGVFSIITNIAGHILLDTRNILLNELKRIHDLEWICSKRLVSAGNIVPCENSNCGGYTLEAELNIPSNSISGPDFLGWEIKQFNVSNFNRFGSRSISLMDHSPTDGYFNQKGAKGFIEKYGYADKMGRLHRMNFGGIHKNEIVHKLTSLRLIIDGFDPETKKITKNHGYVALVDNKMNIAASWSFSSIIDHWKRKHPQACYVPSKLRKGSFEKCNQQYMYGNNIILGNYTDVTLFLYQLYLGNIYYDPGIKLELEIMGERTPSVKVRSLFRTKPITLSSLYYKNEIVDITNL